MSVRRLRPPLYPIVIPVAYVLNFWSASAVHPGGLVRTLVITVAVSLVVCVVAGAIAGRTLGGLAAFAALVGFVAPPQTVLGSMCFAIAILVLAMGVVRRNEPLVFGAVIDRVMLVLTVIVSLAVGIRMVTGGSIGNAISDVQLAATPRCPVAEPAADARDIVIVMLDGFPGDAAARLAEEAGSPYDPDAFPDALTDLGFHVQRNSHSNYLLTPMTLASTFDMRHFADIPGFVGGTDMLGQNRPFRRLLNESEALDVLCQAGYETIWVDAGFNTIEARRVDRWIDHGQPNELEIRLLALTTAGRIVTTAAPDLMSSLHRDRVLTALADIPRLIDEPHDRPRFVFIHVPSPHAPWIFGPNGEPRTETLGSFFADPVGPRSIDRGEAIRRVFDQATFVADRTTSELADLVERPDPPVVVLFSDHGPGTNISFKNPITSDLVERSSNFFATFTPGRPGLFDRFTTPINIFPTLFDGYLDRTFPLQPDTIYAWKDSELNLFPVEVDGTGQ